ncbi:hypothetical protein, partial [Streptomyces longwoodensis]|uniref:hypothetical protein n=1 Tax=Streptomyces longwoodensis TaxID=68231 RepID=UPI0033FCBC63
AAAEFFEDGGQRGERVRTVDVEPKVRLLRPVVDRVVKKSLVGFTDAAIARAQALTAASTPGTRPDEQD